MTESSKRNGAKSGVNRRDFMKGSGAAAAAAAFHAQPVAVEDTDTSAVVRGEKEITLNVNGGLHRVVVEPRTTLLEALRYQLDLTGAKPVSLDGSSGASTVLIDGKTKMASTMLAIACEGKQVQTVESFGGEKPDEVCTAFLKHDAQQCGFCTPGFVVAVRAFLNKNPKANEEEIRAGLNGNICRCGTYANIVQAVIAVVTGGE